VCLTVISQHDVIGHGYIGLKYDAIFNYV